MTASGRLRDAMSKHGISRQELIIRTSNDENIPYGLAEKMVDQFALNGGCPLGVAAALICIISEQQLAKHSEV